MIKPSRIIGPADNPYMLRWHVLRVKKLPRIYVHKFMRSDEDRALHDHPWWFVSILLKGSYREIRGTGIDSTQRHIRRAPSIAYRHATDRHRIELIGNRPWTLFITGPVIRKWGFWCIDRDRRNGRAFGERFVPVREFNGCD